MDRLAAILMAWGVCIACLWLPTSLHAATIHIATPQPAPSETINLGIRYLEETLSAQNHTVLISRGSLPEMNAALEIILSPFDPQSLPAETGNLFEDVIAKQPGAMTLLKVPREGGLRVYAIGIDDIGTLYAAYELMDQLESTRTLTDFDARITETRQAPFIPVRGVRCMLDETSLREPFSWFHSESWWVDYLDRLSRARFNLVELAGVFDTAEGNQSLWPYFAETSLTSVEGVERNRASLQRIVELASVRGLFVCLTTLSTGTNNEGFSVPQVQSIWRDFSPLEGMGYEVSSDATGSANRILSLLQAQQNAQTPPLFLLSTTNSNPNGIEAIAERYRGRAVARIPMNSIRFGLDFIQPSPAASSADYWSYAIQPRSFGVLFDIDSAPIHGLIPWADHTFVRNVLTQVPVGESSGFILDDQATPGAPGLRPPGTPPASRRSQWLSYNLWGHLAYNINWSEDEWQSRLAMVYGPDAAPRIHTALEHTSHILPAIQSTRTADSIREQPFPLYAPPPGVSTLINEPHVDSFRLHTTLEHVRSLTGSGSSARQGAFERLRQAREHIQQALDHLEEASRHLDPGQQPPLGLIEQETLENFHDWQTWHFSFTLLYHLTESWLHQLNAALQYTLYQETGDIPSLVLASESVRQGYASWNRLLSHCEEVPPITVWYDNEPHDLHWNRQATPFEQDIRMLNDAYNRWAETTEWNGSAGHFSPQNTPPGQSVLLTLSIPPRLQTRSLLAMVRNSEGTTRQLPLRTSRIDGVYFAEVPPDEVIEGRLEYFFVGTVDGEDFSARRATNNRPFSIPVTTDTTGPRILDVSHQPGGENARVTARVTDPSGVSAVNLLWKELPGRSEWNRAQMQPGENGYQGRLPVGEAGVMYAIEAADTYGISSRFPDSDVVPYLLFEPSP